MGAYLAVTSLALLAGGINDRRSIATFIAHCLALAAVVVAGIGAVRARWRVLADWLPLLLVPFLYAELPYLMRGAGAGPPFHDALVQTWERATFGGQPARTLAGALPSKALSEGLHIAYLSYYPLIFSPPLLLYVTRRRDAFEETVFAVMLAYVICFSVFILFPVQGPRYLWPSPSGIVESPIRRLVLSILEGGSSRGAAFPSSHVAVAVVQALMALRWRTPGAPVYALAALGVALGAVYGGFHYATDVLAGVAVAALAVGLAALRSPATPSATLS